MSFAQFRQEGTYTPDSLLSGDSDDAVAIKGTLAAGNNLKRGTVLGKITASKKYTLSLTAVNDGSQAADVILTHDADATSGDVEVLVYVGGQFNKNAVTYGAGHSLDTVFDTLRAKGILII